MKNKRLTLGVLVLLGLLWCAATPVLAEPACDTVSGNFTLPQDHQATDPGNPLYGLKIALENIDESFTYNSSERLQKEICHTNLRLYELQHALAGNDTETVNKILDIYQAKYNQTEISMENLDFNGTRPMTVSNDTRSPEMTGLRNSWEMLYRHQEVLQNLSQNYPDNPGLARAYDNSLESRYRFEEKIRERAVTGEITGNGNGKNQPYGTPAISPPGKATGSTSPTGNVTGDAPRMGNNGPTTTTPDNNGNQADNAIRNTSGKSDQTTSNQGNRNSNADKPQGNSDGNKNNTGNSRQAGR
ncbi:MAG: DUF5667 domain-containing protein [Methanoregula sp.]